MVRSFITADAYQRVLGDGATPLLVIEQATSTLRSGTTGPINLAMLSGGFTYRSVLSGGRTVTVHTPLELAYSWNTCTPAPDGKAPETLGELPLGDPFSGGTPRSEEQNAAVDRVRLRWAFVTGMLVVEAEDGSRVTLDADTGELDTVRITIDAGRGEGGEERVIEWPGSWFRVLAPHTLPSIRAEEVQYGRLENSENIVR